MHRSSETIGVLAAALAKAQGELINPEKSLTATIRVPGAAGERSFKYAPLASGLDIVRKGLGRHEIAAVQTTSIDPAAGLVRLTTVLAHASGEWISSEWPVCPVGETANPQRMGAALTYARRYALFTLVGIAGEDDLDAPDPPISASIQAHTPAQGSNGSTPREPGRGNRNNKISPPLVAPMLSEADSSILRDKLLQKLDLVSSPDSLTAWASENIAAKSTLTEADAARIDAAFHQQLAKIAPREERVASPEPATQTNPSHPQKFEIMEKDQRLRPPINRGSGRGAGIDKSVLAISEPKRHRNREHLKFVARQACLVCGREPSDPHHLRFAQSRGLGLKVSDEFAVPLCRSHHREVHRSSNEAAWWAIYKIQPLTIAAALWSQSRSIKPSADESSLPAHKEATRTPSSKHGRKYKTKPIAAGGPS